MSTLKLKLNENNNLQFSLEIKGLVKESNQKQPIVRFSIQDKKTGLAVSVPALLKENLALVKIPDLSNIFTESVEYTGILEVFIGNEYHVPTKVDINFANTIKVAAKLLENSDDDLDDLLPEIQNVLKPTAKQVKTVSKKIIEKAVFSSPNEPTKTPSSRKETVVETVEEKPIRSPSSDIFEEEDDSKDDVFEAYKRKLKSMLIDK